MISFPCPVCERRGPAASCVLAVAAGRATDVARDRQLEALGFDASKPGSAGLEIWRCLRCGYLLIFHPSAAWMHQDVS